MLQLCARLIVNLIAVHYFALNEFLPVTKFNLFLTILLLCHKYDAVQVIKEEALRSEAENIYDVDLARVTVLDFFVDLLVHLRVNSLIMHILA